MRERAQFHLKPHLRVFISLGHFRVLRSGCEVGALAKESASVAVVCLHLLDASFVVAICGDLYEFASADFFNDASAKPLPN